MNFSLYPFVYSNIVEATSKQWNEFSFRVSFFPLHFYLLLWSREMLGEYLQCYKIFRMAQLLVG